MVLLTILVTGIMTGCDTSDQHQNLPEPITLRVAWWGGQLRNDLTSQVIERYEKLNPHIKIDYEYVGFGEYWKKLSIHAAGNSLPDIMQMDISYLKPYASLNLLEDLTPYTQNGLIDVAHINPDKLSGGSLDGKLYGFNLGVNAWCSMYDPEVLRANGVPEPEPGYTWSDLEAMGERVKGSGIYLGTNYTAEQLFAYYLRQSGSALFDPDGTKLGYEDDRLFVDFFARMQRLAGEKLIYTPDTLTKEVSNPAPDPFASGQSLFTWGFSNQLAAVEQYTGKQLKIAPMPGPDMNKGMFLKPGMFFSIAKNSRYKEEAARFIDYFVNDLEANIILNGDRGVPVSSKILEGMLPLIKPELAQVFAYISWVEKNSSPMDPPDPAGASDVVKLLYDLNDRMLFGVVKPEAAAAEFRQKANEILSRNQP